MKSNWKTFTIGDVCDVVNGGTPKTGVDQYWGGEHLWITPAEMGKRSSPYASKTVRMLTNSGLGDSSARLLPPFSVILSSRAPIGHLVINTEPMATNQGCKGLVPGNAIQYKFLFYYLGGIVGTLKDLGTGATFKELSSGKLKEVSLPVPPLSEQKRIVAILDEALDGIAAAVASAENSLANASTLFANYLKSMFSQKAEGWFDTRIGDQMRLQRGFDITKDQQRRGGVAVVSSGGIKSFHDTAMVAAPGVVIGRKGTLGKAFYLDRDFWPHDTTLWVKDFKENNPRFVYYFLLALDVIHLDTGAANPALNRNQVHPIRISWPPVNLQKAIVERVEVLEIEIERLKSVYARKLSALTELKQSILQKAFAGELASTSEASVEVALT